MIKFLVLFTLFFNFCSLSLYSQGLKVVKDLRLRTGLGIEKEFFSDFTLYGETAVEFEKDMSIIGKYYAEGGLSYRFTSFLESAVEYRYTYNRKNLLDEFNHKQRLAFHVQARAKIDRLKFYYRIRYQTQDDDIVFYETTQSTKSILKNRVKVKYNLKGTKLSPYCSTELYLNTQENFSANKIKAIFGGEYDLDMGEIVFYYRLDREIGSIVPYLYSTFGLLLKFQI